MFCLIQSDLKSSQWYASVSELFMRIIRHLCTEDPQVVPRTMTRLIQCCCRNIMKCIPYILVRCAVVEPAVDESEDQARLSDVLTAQEHDFEVATTHFVVKKL